jgi:heme exporter protein B
MSTLPEDALSRRPSGRAERPAPEQPERAGSALAPAGARGHDAQAGARLATPRQAPARPPGAARITLTLLHKELALELRTLESVPGMALFALSAFVIFHFALNRGALEGDLAAGVLWVTILLSALLGINRLFVADAQQGGFEALALAPVAPGSILAAKAAALFIYMVALELFAVPAFALLLLGQALAITAAGVVLTLLLGDLAIAIIGTLVGALVIRSRARDLLGPLLSLPLLIPVVIGAASALSPLLAPRAPSFAGWLSASGLRWLTVLGLYDLLFGLIAYALFEFLLED